MHMLIISQQHKYNTYRGRQPLVQGLHLLVVAAAALALGCDCRLGQEEGALFLLLG
jgi:hypothetical protein